MLSSAHQQVDLAPDENGRRVAAAWRVLRHREAAQGVASMVKISRLAGLVHEAATRILKCRVARFVMLSDRVGEYLRYSI